MKTQFHLNADAISAIQTIYLAPLPQKIYKLTQKIQQIDNKKNL